MMKPRQFAKLYDIEHGQVLVMRQHEENAAPEVVFMFDAGIETLEAVPKRVKFGDGPDGLKARDEYFDAIGGPEDFAAIMDAIKTIREMFGQDAPQEQVILPCGKPE